MSEIVSKERLLAGAKPEPFAVSALDGGEVLLRPLSAPEAAEVQSAQVAGLSGAQPGAEPAQVGKAAPRGVGARSRARPEVSISFAETVAGNYRAELLATQYGLVEPALSEEEIAALRPVAIVTEIGREVMRRSGIGQSAQIQQFRRVDGGAGDTHAPPDGEPSGADTGAALASPA